jgi:uncharacterized membrane-anchored protein
MKLVRLAVLLCLAFHAPLSPAQATPPEEIDKPGSVVASLKPQSGSIDLPGHIATLKLDDEFRYLDPSDTQKLLEQLWGNPPGSGGDTLGMVIPKPDGGSEPPAWGVIVSYDEDGHVSDKDANKIDYADLLKTMQKQASDANEERVKQGYPKVTLGGWAEPPHYDAGEHKIYWAKDLSFGDSQHHTLNYFVRVLGRKGVLELNAVAGMDQLDQVRRAMKQVMAMAEFSAGNRYADFDSSTDKLAAYGLAALVAGGIAAKTGLLAKLLAIAFAAKKFLVLIAAGAVAAFRKFFKRKT